MAAGLTPRRADQATAALAGSWTAVHVVHHATDTVVGMGRVIGDGGWYFHVVDMAVLPAHQRRGLGDRTRRAASSTRHGFAETAPGSVGMARTLNPDLT